VRRQCALLGVSRASLYYEPVEESQENLRLMQLIDRQYTRGPVLRKPKNDGVVESPGVSGESEAGGSTNADHGH